MLQQEQDRRKIPDCQMLLLPWTGGRNNESGSILCRRYARLLIIASVMIRDCFWLGKKCSMLQNCHTCHCVFGASFTDYLGMRGFSVWNKEEKHSWGFCDLAVGPKGFKIFKSNCPQVHSFTCLAVAEVISAHVLRGVDWRPGHLISCQKWPQLQVNRSSSPLFAVMALTEASSISTVMSEEAVSPP